MKEFTFFQSCCLHRLAELVEYAFIRFRVERSNTGAKIIKSLDSLSGKDKDIDED